MVIVYFNNFHVSDVIPSSIAGVPIEPCQDYMPLHDDSMVEQEGSSWADMLVTK